MKNLWYIARKDLLLAIKDRNSIFFMLLMPLILITVIGFAFGNILGGSSQIDITVALSNQDNGFVGKAIVQALTINTSQLKITVNQYSDPNKVKDEVANDSNVNAGIVIPAGTSDKLTAASQSGQLPRNLCRFMLCPVRPIRDQPSSRIL